MKKLFYIIVFLAFICVSQNVLAENQTDNNSFIRDDLINIQQATKENTTINTNDNTTINTLEQNVQKNTTDNASIDTQTQNTQKDTKDNNSQQVSKEENNDTKKPPKWWRQRGSYFGLGHIFD